MKKNYLHVISLFVLAFLLIHCKDDDDSLPADDGPPTQVEDPNPDIFSFAPALGKTGIQVTLKGVDFDAEPGGNTVRFNGVASQIDTASETTLVVTVPENATTGKITLESHGKTYTSFQDFTVIHPPIIMDFEPKTGVEGDEVTLTGEHFGEDMDAVQVLFYGSEVPAEIQSISDTELVVRVPDAFSGPLVVKVFGQETTSEDDFTYLPWRRMKDFEHQPRRFGIAEAIAGKIYMGLGYNDDNGCLGDFWEYDPESDIWTQLENFPGEERFIPFHFVIDGFLYVGCGVDETTEIIYNDFYRFDPGTKTWIQLNDFPGNPGQGRFYPSSFVINGKAYLYGGWKAPNFYPTYNDLWEYDPTQDLWIEKAGFEDSGRAAAVGFSTNGKGYIATGMKVDLNNSTYRTQDIWEYDPGSNTWKEKAPLPPGLERYGAFGFNVGSHGLLGLGSTDESKTYGDVWFFNPSENGNYGSWTKKSTFEDVARLWPFSAMVGQKIYIGLGSEYVDNAFKYHMDIWEYTPAHDQ